MVRPHDQRTDDGQAAESRLPSSASVIRIECARLSPFDQLAWIVLCAGVRQIAASAHVIEVSEAGLSPVCRQVVASGTLAQFFPGTEFRVSSLPRVPDPATDFVALSGSEVFTSRLLTRFSHIFVQPSQAPGGIDAALYFHERAEGNCSAAISKVIADGLLPGAEPDLHAFLRRFALSARKVTLMTSVYRGDAFLDGFLANSAALHDYSQHEHFLVRAASPGDEHEALLRHVQSHPSAVYANLAEDPGLYGVWNLVICLASGRYLTSANLDDRRSPEHVQRMVGILEAEPEVDVASSALYVSQAPNLEWAGAAGEKRMFSAEDHPKGRYDWTRLFRQLQDGTIASRNMPHCMPVWRRALHGRQGLFRERLFGPSADWEFWLRCGKGGTSFYLYPHPLGLYHKSPQSYWNAGSAKADFDGEIVRRYHPESHQHAEDAAAQVAIEREELQALSRWGGAFALFHRLCHLASVARGSNAPDGMEELADQCASGNFGISGFARSAISRTATVARTVSERDAFDLAMFFLAEADLADGGSLARQWQRLVLDFMEIGEEYEALIALGYIHWVTGKQESAWQILREAYARRGSRFWPVLQALFRFRLSMETLLSRIGATDAVVPPQGLQAKKLNLHFYPNYPDNAYQVHLYHDLKAAGASVKAIEHQRESVDSVEPEPGKDNVLHLHWINAIFKGPDRGRDQKIVAQEFFAKLTALQRQGVRVVWTVHNQLSHEVLDAGFEWSFRRELAERVDDVVVHHPMIVDALDWLPPSVQPSLVEHGPYDPPDDWRRQRETARKSLGVGPAEKLVVCSGKIKPYKQLELFLPALLDWLERTPNARVHVLGETRTDEVTKILSSFSSNRLLVVDRLLSDTELETHLHAADIGFLSYASILTSGSMFHMLSKGLPVIAPRKGTIPAYVLNGWNGLLYDGPDDVPGLLDFFASMNETGVARLRDNALSTAKRLSWDLRLGPAPARNHRSAAMPSIDQEDSRADEARYLSACAKAGEDMWNYFKNKAAIARQGEAAQRRAAEGLRKRLAEIERKVPGTQREMQFLAHDRDQLVAHARYLERELAAIRGSTSWTLTAPLRWLVAGLKRMVTGRAAGHRQRPFPRLKSIEQESARTDDR